MKIVIIIVISIFLGLCGKKVAGDSKQLPILKICTESLVQAIPPMWCWKEGGDFGIIPKDCPKGYDRHFEMCFEKCKEGYRFSFGVCVKQCDEGYKEKAIISNHKQTDLTTPHKLKSIFMKSPPTNQILHFQGKALYLSS